MQSFIPTVLSKRQTPYIIITPWTSATTASRSNSSSSSNSSIVGEEGSSTNNNAVNGCTHAGKIKEATDPLFFYILKIFVHSGDGRFPSPTIANPTLSKSSREILKVSVFGRLILFYLQSHSSFNYADDNKDAWWFKCVWHKTIFTRTSLSLQRTRCLEYYKNNKKRHIISHAH